MTPAFLRASLDRQPGLARAILGAAIPAGWPDCPDVLALRLRQLEEDPSFAPWSLRAMVLRSENAMVGRIGFHTVPDPGYLAAWGPGVVELGYGVCEPWRRRGLAREAALALMDWAHRERGVNRFVVSISPDNPASLAMAEQMGFRRIGSHLDPEDGPEDVFLRVHAPVPAASTGGATRGCG